MSSKKNKTNQDAAGTIRDFLKTKRIALAHCDALELAARLQRKRDHHQVVKEAQKPDNIPRLYSEHPEDPNCEDWIATGPVWIAREQFAVRLYHHDQEIEIAVYRAGHEDEDALKEITVSAANLPKCQKCDSPLDHGLCLDETCPYSKWEQKVPLNALYSHTDAQIEKLYSTKKHPKDRVPSKGFTFSQTLKIPQVWQQLLEIEDFDTLHPQGLTKHAFAPPEAKDEHGNVKPDWPKPLRDDQREVWIEENGYTAILQLNSGDHNYWTTAIVRGPNGFQIESDEPGDISNEESLQFGNTQFRWKQDLA